LQAFGVLIGNSAAQNKQNIFRLLFAKERYDARNNSIVCARKNGKANAVYVFLNGGTDDHLRCLAQSSVNDLHSCIAERAGDDLSSAVVAIETGLGDKYANWRGPFHSPQVYAGRHQCLRVVCHALEYFQLV